MVYVKSPVFLEGFVCGTVYGIFYLLAKECVVYEIRVCEQRRPFRVRTLGLQPVHVCLRNVALSLP